MLIECDAGTFGTNCSGTCGHCHKGQSCDKEWGRVLKDVILDMRESIATKVTYLLTSIRVLFHLYFNEIF